MSCSNPIITSLTPSDFKTQFYRGFEYLPTYDNLKTYNIGAVVYLDSNGFFYSCLQNGTLGQTPPNETYWTLLPEISKFDYIVDEDITNAYDESCIVFNEALFSSDEDLKKAYLYLTAHNLVGNMNLEGSESNGMQLLSSRSVGSISESYTLPEWLLKHPVYSNYASTAYGQKYLNMIATKLIGNVVTVEGKTDA